MSISLSSTRRLAASAVGATAVAGAMLFGAAPAANAAPAVPPPAVVGLHHVAPAGWHPASRHGFGHGRHGGSAATVTGVTAAAGDVEPIRQGRGD